MPSNKSPHPPDETAEHLKTALRRNHPELTDADIDRILGGPPARRRNPPPRLDNRGKREAPFAAVSTGRTTSAQGVTSESAEKGA